MTAVIPPGRAVWHAERVTSPTSAAPHGMTEPVGLADSIVYQPGGIVSRQILKKPAGNVTLFAFDAGQELSVHTSPFDALVCVLEGESDISIDTVVHRVRDGEMLLLPAQVPHGVRAVTPFKMTLTMIRA